MRSKSELAVELSKLKVFGKSELLLEQYPTPGEIGADLLWNAHFLGDIKGKIILFNLPVKNNLRGVTLFSRKKLVSLPESFPIQGSSHFYQYLTGWLEIDFIDNLRPDVIATNRSSLNWNDKNLEQLQLFLEKVINYIHGDWRTLIEKRKEKKIKKNYGVDIPVWRETNKNNPTIVKQNNRIANPNKILNVASIFFYLR